MYSPQQYRQDNTAKKPSHSWNAIVATVIGAVVGYVIFVGTR